ncbi:MAG: hypothetical protein JSV80_08550 [Acidobacteriota bacterium]|nr:MAG: hypothetical protein JSV80_08550 [Acidobacteriota bacterium]
MSTELPYDDGWGWLYRAYNRLIEPHDRLRRIVRAYFVPTQLERSGNGKLYRALGVHLFGRVIPTGGILVRRLTGARMRPYTLAGSSLGAARDFFYRACVFEVLHLPFFIALLFLSAHRLSAGRLSDALENAFVNLLINAYPIMHHRHTRVRILRLLRSRERNSRCGEIRDVGSTDRPSASALGT